MRVFWRAVFWSAALGLLPAAAGAEDIKTDGSLKINEVSVSQGDEYSVSAVGLQRVLLAQSDLLSITDQTPDGFRVRTLRLGSALILYWDAQGGHSVRVQIKPTQSIVNKQKQYEAESLRTKLGADERSFKIYSETQGLAVRTGREFSIAKEQNKSYDQSVRVTGRLPWADLDAKTDYGYLKDASLEESIAKPRHYHARLSHHPLPIIEEQDIVLGSFYDGVHDMVMPDSRLEGVAIVTDENQTGSPEGPAKPYRWTGMLGRERDGSTVDSQPGFANRKLKDRIMGQRLDWDWNSRLTTSVGTASRWSGPKEGQGDWGHFVAVDAGDEKLDFKADLGMDELYQHATVLQTGAQHEGLTLRGRWRDINKHYLNIGGSGPGRGELGWGTEISWEPFRELPDRQQVLLSAEYDRFRNRLDVRVERPKDYNDSVRGRLLWQISEGLTAEWYASRTNQMASSFSHLDIQQGGRIDKSISWNMDWLRQSSVSFGARRDDYDKADASPGFNAQRWEYELQSSHSFAGGQWVSAGYRRAHLNEDTPAFLPARIRPYEWVLGLGWSHEPEHLPLSISWSILQSLRKGTVGKQHEQVPAENSTQAGIQMTWQFKEGGEAYARLSFIAFRPRNEQPESSEMSITGGMRWEWDTGFYFQKSVMIRGRVYEDVNGNRKWDELEPVLSGYRIEAGENLTADSDKEGKYELRLSEGMRVIRMTTPLPEGYFYASPNRYEKVLLPDEEFVFDFFVSARLQMRGRVYLDVNEDGKYDPGDLALSGVRLRLDSGQQALSQSVGLYSILNLPPGKRKMSVDVDSVPMGYRGTSAMEQEFSGRSGEVVEKDIVFIAARTLSGRVFLDKDGDKLFSPADEGLGGIKVRVGEKEVKTNKDGRYRVLKLQPGKIQIHVDETSLPSNHTLIDQGREVEISRQPVNLTDVNFAVSSNNV